MILSALTRFILQSTSGFRIFGAGRIVRSVHFPLSSPKRTPLSRLPIATDMAFLFRTAFLLLPSRDIGPEPADQKRRDRLHHATLIPESAFICRAGSSLGKGFGVRLCRC